MLRQQVVDKIRAAIKEGKKQRDIAAEFGISRSLVSDIACGRRYKDKTSQDQLLDLQAEIAHLKEEKAQALKAVKASVKDYGLFREVTRELERKIQPYTKLPDQYVPAKSTAKKSEHLVMHLSDGHHDQIVRPEECGGLEHYNFPISCARAERYVRQVINWSQKTLAYSFNFPVLWILAYGDHTSGEIHGQMTRSYFRNQFKNCFAIGQLHAMMIRDLEPFFSAVNVVYLSGNHGRRTPKKDYHGAQDNWDYLIGECARLHCRDLKRVNFLIPNAYSINLDINGMGFHLTHGDDIKGNLGIPFYGMIRRQKNLAALAPLTTGPRIRYFCMGHHHTASTLSDIDGELLVNGSWVGTDSYAYNSFAGYREPSQWIHGVSSKYGITWRLKVDLKQDDEANGPQRYHIEV